MDARAREALRRRDHTDSFLGETRGRESYQSIKKAQQEKIGDLYHQEWRQTIDCATKHTNGTKTKGPKDLIPAANFRVIGVIRGLFFEDQWTKVVLRVERASRGSTEVLRE
jgi:hypothetical protein